MANRLQLDVEQLRLARGMLLAENQPLAITLDWLIQNFEPATAPQEKEIETKEKTEVIE